MASPTNQGVLELNENLDKCAVEVLKGLHVFLYENFGKDNFVKRNIREFKEFKFVKGDNKYEKRLKIVKDTVNSDIVLTLASFLSVECDAESSAEKVLDRLIELYSQDASAAKNTVTDRQSLCSSKSRRSNFSHAEIEFDLAKKELEVEEKLAALEDEIFALQEEIIGFESEIKKLELMDIIPERTLITKQNDLATAQRHLDVKRSRLNSQRKLLEKHKLVAQCEANARKELIQEEEEDTEKIDSGQASRVNDWLKSQETGKHEAASLELNSVELSPPQERMDNLTQNINRMLARQTVGSNLGKFDGTSSLRWPIFLSQFKRTSEVCGFSPAENVLRLDECLIGDARKKVEMLLITASDTEEILQILNTSYGKQEIIAEELSIRAKNVRKVDTLAEFEDFSCEIRNITSALENINGEFVNKRKMLATFVNKLPPHLMTQWGSYLIENNLDANNVRLKDFTKWTQNMSSMLSKITFVKERLPQNSKEIQNQECKEEKQNKNKSNDFEPKACGVCKNGQHSLDQCSTFRKADVKQRWKLAEKTRTCYCCLHKHNGKCRTRKPCGINDCVRYHNALLHKTESSNSSEATNCVKIKSTGAILKMLPVRLRGPLGEIETVAFLDDGSTGSLVDADVAKKIGLTGPSSPLCCKWTGATFRYDQNSKKVSLSIVGLGTKKSIAMNNVRTVQDLDLTEQRWNVSELIKKFSYINQVDLSAVKHGKPMILIGQAHASLIVSREVIQPQENSPILSRTDLGWIVHGPTELQQDSQPNVEIIFACCELSENIHEEVKKYFTIENFGAAVLKQTKSMSLDQEKALGIAKESIKKLENRYEVGIPWKTKDFLSEGSKEMAFQRLKCLEKKLLKDSKLGTMYQEEFAKLIKKRYAEEVNESELLGKKKVWFLPHFGVSNPNKPGKVRLVFDAAAKVGGKSLNDHIYTGPDWLTSLFGIIIKFRQYSIGFTADIREMFNRVKIAEEDSFAQCFLWRSLDPSASIKIYRMTAMIFGMASSPFLAQFVKNTHAEKFQNESPAAVKAIVENHYVDDYIHGAKNEEEAIKLIREVIHIHDQAGFELRDFSSNNQKVLKSVSEDRRADCTFTKVDKKSTDQRILGMIWDTLTDSLTFSMNFCKVEKSLIELTRVPTKREVLKIIMSAYDPMGFMSPITVKGRMILQSIWRTGIGWDDFITAQMFSKWKQWLTELKQASKIRVPRCYSPNLFTAKDIQIHTFCDASELAYATSIYLRIQDNGAVETILIASKARVAPLRTLTVPKLELLAAVLGVRLANTVKDSLEIQVSKNFFWSDSTTVLRWLASEKKLPTFEAARVGEILESSNLEAWNWVPTKENVADDCTRDTPSINFDENHRWFSGPAFLKISEDSWPQSSIHSKGNNLDDTEFTMPITIVSEFSDSLPQIKWYYSWIRILRITAWIKRFIENMREGRESSTRKTGPLEAEELEWSEKKWWRTVQETHFREERKESEKKTLYKKKRKSGKLKRVETEIDEDGLLRISGRLSKIDNLNVLTKSPICLDGNHEYVKLMIKYYHQKNGHQGTETVLNELRKRFWIPKARSIVKKVIFDCLYCKRKNCKPAEPKMAPIPKDRVISNKKAFTSTGVDYFGPFQVKIGRRLEKRYGVLFTCLTTRAIHLEVAHSLSTDSCIMAIRRFLARRGEVKKMRSDNGTNLRGANRELLEAFEELDERQIQDEMTNRKIDWKFNPPAAPHMGGSWERMVRSVKISIYAIMREQHPTDEVLRTVFTEAEYIVNSRPLTYVSSDSRDLLSISPNDILIGQSVNIGTPGYFTEYDNNVRRQWRISQYLSNLFWKRWLKEYLPSLNFQTKWFQEKPTLKEGEIVLIGEENLPRATWALGVIQRTYQGNDGVVRMADVRTAKGVKTRPAVKLYPLELFAENKDSAPGGGNVTKPLNSSNQTTSMISTR